MWMNVNQNLISNCFAEFLYLYLFCGRIDILLCTHIFCISGLFSRRCWHHPLYTFHCCTTILLYDTSAQEGGITLEYTTTRLITIIIIIIRIQHFLWTLHGTIDIYAFCYFVENPSKCARVSFFSRILFLKKQKLIIFFCNYLEWIS